MQQHQWMLQRQLTQCQNEWSAQADMYKKQEAEVTQQIHQCRNTLKVLKQLQTAGLAPQSSPAMVADFGELSSGHDVPRAGVAAGPYDHRRQDDALVVFETTAAAAGTTRRTLRRVVVVAAPTHASRSGPLSR